LFAIRVHYSGLMQYGARPLALSSNGAAVVLEAAAATCSTLSPQNADVRGPVTANAAPCANLTLKARGSFPQNTSLCMRGKLYGRFANAES